MTDKDTLKILYLIVIVLLSSVYIHCGHGIDARSERSQKGIVIIGVDSAPESMDPRIGTSMASYRVHQLLFNPLVNQGPDGSLMPGLAESWAQIGDEEGKSGQRFRFKLRQHVKFHNGKECTAEDVAYTFTSMLKPDFISRKKAAFSAIKDIVIVDKYTIVFSLSRFQPAFLSNLPAVGIIPAGFPDDGSKKPVGTGPFKFESKVGTQQYHFSSNFEYFRGAPGINKLILKVIPDDTTRALELMHGSIDLVLNDLNVADAAMLGSWKKLKMIKGPGLPYEYIGINHTHPILGKRLVRQAIAHAIDRKTIIENLLGGLARSAISPMIPALWKTDINFLSYDYNVSVSKKLLDEAGYPDPDGDGPKTRFSIELKCSSRKVSRDLATVLGQQLAAVGIDVNIRSSEWQTYYSDIVNGNFAMYQLRWIGIIDPEFFGSIFHSSSIPGYKNKPGEILRGSLNRGRYQNPEMDTLIEQAEAETDENKRWRIYVKIQQLVSEDLPYIDLWYRDNYAVMRSDLEGLELTLNASFGVFYKLHYSQN